MRKNIYGKLLAVVLALVLALGAVTFAFAGSGNAALGASGNTAQSEAASANSADNAAAGNAANNAESANTAENSEAEEQAVNNRKELYSMMAIIAVAAIFVGLREKRGRR